MSWRTGKALNPCSQSTTTTVHLPNAERAEEAADRVEVVLHITMGPLDDISPYINRDAPAGNTQGVRRPECTTYIVTSYYNS